MRNKILLGIGGIVVLAVAYWLVSPFWRNVTLDEALPVSGTMSVKDNLKTIDAKTEGEFERQTMEMKDKVMPKTDAMPENAPSVLGRTNMIARAHEVGGSALLVSSGGETFLRFEDLKTINGPDLRIYLASDLSENDIVDLGPIRATSGNVNYPIPAGTNLDKYKYAMIWCRAFGVLFSYAEFK